MPTGVYKRTEELKIKMRQSHQKGWVSTYKKQKESHTATGVPKTIEKAIRGWTKWGGPTNRLLAPTKEWYCQACTEKQADGLPRYLVWIDGDDYGRVCSVCLHKSIVLKSQNIFDLIKFLGRVIPDVDNS